MYFFCFVNLHFSLSRENNERVIPIRTKRTSYKNKISRNDLDTDESRSVRILFLFYLDARFIL